MTRPFERMRRLRAGVVSVLLLSATGSYALNTATIVGSVASPDCLEYRVVGICYWLYCTWTGCTVRTSIKVRHYIPDAVVSSYSNTGENPWVEVRAMSAPNPSAQAGGDGTTNEDHENNLAKFKNADVIGHPGVEVFNQFVSSSGYFCEGAGTAFMPYLLSTLDTLAWRYNVPEMAYPEALIPGRREVGARTTMNLWGTSIRAAASCTRRRPQGRRRGGPARRRCRHAPWADSRLSAAARQLAARLLACRRADGRRCLDGQVAGTHARLSSSCTVFPRSGFLTQAQQGDYAWALWRPYACCERRGQVFLGSVDFQ